MACILHQLMSVVIISIAGSRAEMHQTWQALLIAMNYPGTPAERKCGGNDLDKVTGILLRWLGGKSRAGCRLR